MYSSMFSLVAVLCIFLRHRLEWTGLHLILFPHNHLNLPHTESQYTCFPAIHFSSERLTIMFFLMQETRNNVEPWLSSTV